MEEREGEEDEEEEGVAAVNRDEIIAGLQQVCLPCFEALAAELRVLHPSFTIRVGSDSVGSKTSFQGYFAYIECFRADSGHPEPNCIAIEACVRNLDTDPTLCTLDVNWGGDGVAPCELESGMEKEVPWGESAVIEIQSMLPKLSVELKKALLAWESTHPTFPAKQ